MDETNIEPPVVVARRVSNGEILSAHKVFSQAAGTSTVLRKELQKATDTLNQTLNQIATLTNQIADAEKAADIARDELRTLLNADV